jgi:hypothetical protein
VLAVVEDDQRLARGQMRDERLQSRAGCGDRHADGQRSRLLDEHGVADARQVDKPSAVGQLRQRVRRDLERQPRLAAAPGAGERHQLSAAKHPRDVRALALTADERGQLAREVATARRRRARRRRQQLLVELAGRGVRLGRQLGVETLAQHLILGQRLLATAGAREQAHERAVGGLRERVGDQRALQSDHGGWRIAVQLGELEAQRGVQLGERSPPSVGPRLVAVLGQQLAAVRAERPLIRGRVAIGSRAGRSSLEGIDVNPSPENDRAVQHRQCGRAVSAGAVERAASGIEGLVQVVRGRVGGAVAPQQLGEALAVHAAVGRQRKDLDQRLGLAQPPRTIRDDVVADGDRETAQQANVRLGAVARDSPLPNEPSASTQGRRGRRARRRPPSTGPAREPRARNDRPRHARAGRRRWRAECGRQPVGPHQARRSARHVVPVGQLHDAWGLRADHQLAPGAT